MLIRPLVDCVHVGGLGPCFEEVGWTEVEGANNSPPWGIVDVAKYAALIFLILLEPPKSVEIILTESFVIEMGN